MVHAGDDSQIDPLQALETVEPLGTLLRLYNPCSIHLRTCLVGHSFPYSHLQSGAGIKGKSKVISPPPLLPYSYLRVICQRGENDSDRRKLFFLAAFR